MISAVMSQSLGIIVLLCALSSARAKYPSSYPFESEADPAYLVGHDDFPTATPDWTLSESDPGGYVHEILNCDLADDLPPGRFSILYCKGMAHVKKTWFQAKTPTVQELDYINCTAPTTVGGKLAGEGKTLYDIVGKKYDPTSGAKTDEDWCTKETCCSYYESAGTSAGTFAAFDFAAASKRVDYIVQQMKTKRCDRIFLEEVCYRMYILNTWCIQNYVRNDKRKIIMHCPDVSLHFQFHCKLLMVESTDSSGPSDPPKYVSQLSTKQRLQAYAVAAHPDRVCHPYSYFYPSVSKSSASSATSSAVSSAATSAATPAASSVTQTTTSGATQHVAVLMMLVMISVFMA